MTLKPSRSNYNETPKSYTSMCTVPVASRAHGIICGYQWVCVDVPQWSCTCSHMLDQMCSLPVALLERQYAFLASPTSWILHCFLGFSLAASHAQPALRLLQGLQSCYTLSGFIGFLFFPETLVQDFMIPQLLPIYKTGISLIPSLSDNSRNSRIPILTTFMST